jgi:hypothetical protein
MLKYSDEKICTYRFASYVCTLKFNEKMVFVMHRVNNTQKSLVKSPILAQKIAFLHRTYKNHFFYETIL